ncbi:unnamed protein product [Macrosiphum euphorbiae]|uniref:C2H2-type domain-containing protein n=1 Tax=Macrosiphum euphorbiae TaxID=13131 RepID=A0AAV0Y2N2_9HEMI|nr:unnamed protein product [Macrosiphum euphorbiae]
MFKCVKCPSVFNGKRNLVAHQNAGVRFPCTVCPSTFSSNSSLNRHQKNAHGIVNVPTHLRPIPAAQMVQPTASITTPQIFVPDVPTAGGSNAISEDDLLCVINEDNDTG